MICVNQACVPGQADAAAGDAGGTGGMTGGSGAVDGGGTSGGTGGMTGGSGGDGSVASCTQDDACDAEHPQCNSNGECGPCTSQGACDGRIGTTRCELAASSANRGECVQCTQESHCTGAANKCVQNECVECADSTDCPADKPQCGGGVCGACNSHAACSERAETPFCNTASSGAQRGECVECMTHGQCDNPTPQCGAGHACVACTGNAACAGREETTQCNVRSGLESSGRCVECTAANEDAECGMLSCKQATGECTETEQDSANPCEACEADSECKDGAKCVRHVLGDADLGTFCFYDSVANGGCADTAPAVKPYSVPLTTSSIDAQAATYCLPRTSCQAVADATAQLDCDNTGLPDSTRCGIAEVNDGVCNVTTKTCSYACALDYQCPQGLPDCDDNELICVP